MLVCQRRLKRGETSSHYDHFRIRPRAGRVIHGLRGYYLLLWPFISREKAASKGFKVRRRGERRSPKTSITLKIWLAKFLFPHPHRLRLHALLYCQPVPREGKVSHVPSIHRLVRISAFKACVREVLWPFSDSAPHRRRACMDDQAQNSLYVEAKFSPSCADFS